jgi:hypothetical protein
VAIPLRTRKPPMDITITIPGLLVLLAIGLIIAAKKVMR